MSESEHAGPPDTGEVDIALTLTFREGTVAEVLDGLQAGIAPTRAEPGNLRFEVYSVPARPDTVFILERWRDKAALERHWQLPHARVALDLFDKHLAEPLVDGENVLYVLERGPEVDRGGQAAIPPST